MSRRIEHRARGCAAGLFKEMLGVAAILLGLAALVGSVGYAISVSRPADR
ncbi:MAG: hypothetical protein Q7W30_04535 [Coriobacteriia bacterium]|nr:hypothetical protein [Coriobacteriia bacterium]